MGDVLGATTECSCALLIDQHGNSGMTPEAIVAPGVILTGNLETSSRLNMQTRILWIGQYC